jgi:NADH-quinone oxidoreductase subunit N
MPVGDVLPELVLLGGTVTVLLVTVFTSRRLQVLAPWLSIVVLGVAGGFTASQLGGPQELTFAGTWALDRSAVLGKLLVLAAAAVGVALSAEWLRPDPRAGEYQTMLLFVTLGGVVLASAADLLELALGLLLSSAGGYVMATYHRRSRESAEAGIKYYLLGALTNALFLYGLVLLFGLAGTTTYGPLTAALAGADPRALVPAVALVALGLAFKVGAAPVHAWVPDVAQGAPLPSAAFLLVVPKVAGLVAVARLAAVLTAGDVGCRPLVALLAVATMTVGNLAAVWQDDVRRLLGWSAVSQTGYALMAPVALGRSALAIPSLLLFLAAYAAANLAAFGAVIELRGLTDRRAFAGLAQTRPLLLAALTIGFLSMVGIPPLAGFAGKLALFAATIEAGYAWLALLAVANTVVSLFYYLRVVGPAYFESPAHPVAVLGPWAAIGTALSTVAVVVIGLAAEPLLRVFTSADLLP